MKTDKISNSILDNFNKVQHHLKKYAASHSADEKVTKCHF